MLRTPIGIHLFIGKKLFVCFNNENAMKIFGKLFTLKIFPDDKQS
jgi:hypothetical protein